MNILQLFTLLGALGMFLYGMNLMSSGLQKAAGERLRGFLSAMTSNPFKGVMTGLKPATLGLIGTAALGLATPENFIDWKSFAICLVAFAGLFLRKIGPFAAIGLGAVAGLLLY